MGGFVWDGFSDETLAIRARLVYQAAIAIYDDLVSIFFPTLRPRLAMAALMPFALAGTVQGGLRSRPPGLGYHLEPLEGDKTNEIRMQLGPDRGTWESVTLVHERIRRLRPEVSAWTDGSVTSTVLEVFGAAPATTLAYRWLSRELKGLGWLERAVH